MNGYGLWSFEPQGSGRSGRAGRARVVGVMEVAFVDGAVDRSWRRAGELLRYVDPEGPSGIRPQLGPTGESLEHRHLVSFVGVLGAQREKGERAGELPEHPGSDGPAVDLHLHRDQLAAAHGGFDQVAQVPCGVDDGRRAAGPAGGGVFAGDGQVGLDDGEQRIEGVLRGSAGRYEQRRCS